MEIGCFDGSAALLHLKPYTNMYICVLIQREMAKCSWRGGNGVYGDNVEITGTNGTELH
jgi:hypothetical protein